MKPRSRSIARVLPIAGVLALVTACGGAPAASTPGVMASSGPTAEVSDFQGMVGAWDGTLTYLDYGDNETRVSLQTSVVYTAQTSGLDFEFAYTEPNGEVIRDEGTLRVLDDGRIGMGLEAFEVQQREVRGPSDALIVMTRRGTDNDRPGMVWRTIQIEGDVLIIRQEILLDGMTDRFTRNEYRFQRTQP